MRSAGTPRLVFSGIDTCASDEPPGIAASYRQLVTFLNAKARADCSNQSDDTNGRGLHEAQREEGLSDRAAL